MTFYLTAVLQAGQIAQGKRRFSHSEYSCAPRLMENDIDDVEILKRIAAGEIELYSLLIRRYQNYVAAVIIRHAGDSPVEELCHDVFVKAFNSLKTYRGAAPFRFWLSAIAVRRCYLFYREQAKSRRETAVSDLSKEAQHWCEKVANEDAQAAFDSADSEAEAKEVVAELLSGLSPEDRLIISLVYLDDRPLKEVAALLGWSVTNVKVRAFRARKIMQKRLEELSERKI